MIPNSFAERFGLRLRAARLNTGLSQAETARRIGRSKQLVSAWEAGRCAILARDLLRVAAVLGCSSDELLGLCDPHRRTESLRSHRDCTSVENHSPSQVGFGRSATDGNGTGD